MIVDWTAALFLITAIAAICAGNMRLTRLVVRDELRKADFVPRKEADLRDKDIDRRLQAVGL